MARYWIDTEYPQPVFWSLAFAAEADFGPFFDTSPPTAGTSGMKRQTLETSDAVDAFKADMNWFMGHVRSLSMTPENCCADQGNFRVAAELFYFLLEPTQLVDDPLSLLSAEQKSAVQRLRDAVRLVPPEARSGGTTATASLTDMSHPSWVTPRQLANSLLEVFLPLWPVSNSAIKV